MIKKLLTYSVVVTMLVWSVGLLATPLAVGAAVSGDLVKKDSSPAVYYLGADSKLHVFPSQPVYDSWYEDFSGVTTISDTEFESYSFGENVFPRPGVSLVQAVDGETPWNIVDPKVYALSGNGVLRHIGSAEVAEEVFGAGWEGLIVPVVLSVFTQYDGDSGDDLTDAADFDKDAEMTDASTINEVKGLGGDGDGDVSTGTGLTVALAADTPATSTIVSNAARVPFTKINLTASADGDIIVDQMIVERAGLGNDLAFSSLDILDADTMLPINNFSKSLGSTHQATFNDNLTVPAGTTKGIILAANMGALASYAGEAPILELASITLTGSAAVIGTLPVAGNYMSTNGTITIGTVTVANGNNNPSASTQNVGTSDYIVSSLKLTAGSAEAVTVKNVTFTQNGSASLTDLENVRLVKSNTGEVLGSMATLTSDTFTFVLDEEIDKGKNVSYDVKADIVNGSGRTISIDVDQTTDIVVSGDTYGYNITPTYTTTGNGSTPEYDAANTTIGDGSLTIQSATVSPTNIAEDQTQVTIGKLKFIVKGEAINITSVGWRNTLTVGLAGSGATTTDITNLTVYDENGDAVAGPIDPTTNDNPSTGLVGVMTATTTDTITVPIGTTVYTVKADLSEDFATNDTLQASISPGSITCKGDTTGNTVTPTPAGIVSSTSLTIKAGALVTSVSSDPAAQNVVVGSEDFTFSKFILDATDSGKDMVITQMQISTDTAGTAYPDLVTNIQIYDGSTEVVPNNYPGSIAYETAGTTATGSATTTYLFDIGDFVVSAGTSKTVVVKADIGSGPTIAGDDDTLALGLHVEALSVQDDQGNSVTPTGTSGDGQSHILKDAGEVIITAKTSPTNGLVIGGSTDVVGKFTLKAKYEDLTVDKIEFNYGDAGGSGIAGDKDDLVSLTLYQDGVAEALGTASVEAANTTITPVTTLTIPKDQEVDFTLYATWAAIDDTTSAEAGSGVKFNLANIEVTSPQSGGTVTRTGHGAQFKSFSVYKSIPTVTHLDNTSTITGYQATNVAKVQITADAAGPIGLYKMTFEVATTTVFLDNNGYYIYESDSASTLGNLIGQSSATAANEDIIDTYTMDGLGGQFLEVYFDIDNDSTTRSHEQLVIDAGTSKYLTLRATPNAGHDSTGGNESIAVSIGGDSNFASSTATRAGGDNPNNEGIDTVPNGNTDVLASAAKDFIWSDLFAEQYSTSTATLTKMWHNGYLVPGLGSGATTTAKVVTD